MDKKFPKSSFLILQSYWYFLAEFTVSNNLDAAIRMWEQLTCIRFVARTPSNMRQYNDYVTIQQTVDG